MKASPHILLTFVLCIQFLSGYSQKNQNIDLSLIKRENIEFESLKSFFYLVRQDYIIVSESNEIIKLGGNDFFGRGIGMGFLTDDKKIWFPSFIRTPWEKDKNFDEYRLTHKPECTLINIKNIQDTAYSVFEYDEFELNQDLLSIPFGITGISYADELITNGSLFIFYSSHPVPENFEDIAYSIIYLNDIIWENGKVIDISIPYLGDKQVLGGALFQRIIKRGMVEWKLSGIYVIEKGNWILKSLK